MEIAEKLEKKVNGVEVDFSNTNYQYVKNLVKSEEKLNNWRDICGWLEDAGYKSQQIVQTQSDNSRNLDAKVHISNINIENQTIELGVLIQLTLPSSSDSSKKDSN